jgi:hypothetical protein
MKTIKYAILLNVIFIFSSNATDNIKSSCQYSQWPFSRTQSKKDLFKQFSHLNRSDLIKYYFGELVEPNKQSVAYELSLHLSQTEFDHDRQQFIKFLATGAELSSTNRQPKRLKIDEICDLYSKIELTKIKENNPSTK